jgi:hypothetical protein
VEAEKEAKKEGIEEKKQDFCRKEEGKQGEDRSIKQNKKVLQENDLNE